RCSTLPTAADPDRQKIESQPLVCRFFPICTDQTHNSTVALPPPQPQALTAPGSFFSRTTQPVERRDCALPFAFFRRRDARSRPRCSLLSLRRTKAPLGWGDVHAYETGAPPLLCR